MKLSFLSVLCSVTAGLLLGLVPADATTLREMYDRAGPLNGYDRWIELEPGGVYTGGLLIGPIFLPYSEIPVGEPGQNVRIVGHGAILDLRGQQICLSYCTNRLDIDDCVIINGNIRFRGYEPSGLLPNGSVRHVTFWRPHDYAVRVCVGGDDIDIERNLVVDVVDTGWDFLFLTGIPSDWLPTGTSFSGGLEAPPHFFENWTFHIDPYENADPLTHFSFL